MSSIVERYLDRLVAHDWTGTAECLASDVERVGPYGDTFKGRDGYIAFLADLMPKLGGYSMRIDRVVEAGQVVISELTETVEIDGTPIVTPEVLVFDLDQSGLIVHIAVYIQRLGGAPPAFDG